MASNCMSKPPGLLGYQYLSGLKRSSVASIYCYADITASNLAVSPPSRILFQSRKSNGYKSTYIKPPCTGNLAHMRLRTARIGTLHQQYIRYTKECSVMHSCRNDFSNTQRVFAIRIARLHRRSLRKIEGNLKNTRSISANPIQLGWRVELRQTPKKTTTHIEAPRPNKASAASQSSTITYLPPTPLQLHHLKSRCRLISVSIKTVIQS